MADSKKDSFTKRAREALAGGSTSAQDGDEVPEPVPAPQGGAGAGASSPQPTPQMPSLDRFLSDAQNKISEVIDAAERVAKDTHADARSQAESYLEGRKRDADTLVANRRAELNEITASMAKRIEDLRAEVDRISSEIGESIARVNELAHSTDDPATTPAPSLSSAPDLQPVADEPDEASAPAEAEIVADAGEDDADVGDANGGDSGTQNREHVVLRATQLAVAGTERGEIEATLVKEFGIDDASSIVDEIVGPAA